jgi:phospholipid transport system substrate-binding protein
VRQSSDGTRSLVRSLIKLDSGSDVEVDYRMYLADAGWRVYDVVVGGVSLAATYRASFGEQIDRGGFDGLIAYLVAQSQ